MTSRAATAVANIEADLCDRRGVRQAWEAIGDHAIKAEILGAWKEIIARAIDEAVREENEACAQIADSESRHPYSDIGRYIRARKEQG